MTSRVRCPVDLIEGPARCYFVMRPETFYKTDEISKATKYAKSTCQRYLKVLEERSIIEVFRVHNSRGRPTNYYRLKTEKETIAV